MIILYKQHVFSPKSVHAVVLLMVLLCVIYRLHDQPVHNRQNVSSAILLFMKHLDMIWPQQLVLENPCVNVMDVAIQKAILHRTYMAVG